ncbi:hypothetical protein MMC14_000611 [Varicellaria rhodocarpa]|nr:hypothetical protein [Varicellaria rhodocarpa]
MAEQDPFSVLTATIHSIDPALLSLSSPNADLISLPPPIKPTWPSAVSSPYATQSDLISPTDRDFVMLPSPDSAQNQQSADNPFKLLSPRSDSCFENESSQSSHHGGMKVRRRHHPYSSMSVPKKKHNLAPTSAPSHSIEQQNIPQQQAFSRVDQSTPTEGRHVFTLHHDQTVLVLGIRQHLSQLMQSCEEMQRYLQEGFSESDRDGNMSQRLEVEKYSSFPPSDSAWLEILPAHSVEIVLLTSKSQHLNARTHNRMLTELHEPFHPLVLPYGISSEHISRSAEIPQTGLDIRRLDRAYLPS